MQRDEKTADSATPSPEKKIPGTWWHPFVSSAGGGAIGGLLCYPPEGMKKRAQTGQAITLYPRDLYRGSGAFATSVMIASVTQMSFFNAFQNLPGYDKESPTWNASAAVLSGMLGATVGSTPVENIILTQQLNKTNPLAAISIMLKQGITRPWVGLPQLMMREAGFGLTMLWGARAAYDAVYQATDNKSYAYAGQLGAALAGAALTQPFDTTATYRQRRDGKISFVDTVKSIKNESGYGGLFKGLKHRSILFTGCALAIPIAEEKIRGLLQGNGDAPEQTSKPNLKH
jgi:hypothetical protein